MASTKQLIGLEACTSSVVSILHIYYVSLFRLSSKPKPIKYKQDIIPLNEQVVPKLYQDSNINEGYAKQKLEGKIGQRQQVNGLRYRP